MSTHTDMSQPILEQHAMQQVPALVEEWRTLQRDHERYEHSSQMPKLAAIVAAAILMSAAYLADADASRSGLLLLAVILPLWAQEAILRTCQARLGERIVVVEGLLRNGVAPAWQALQLHSAWLAARPGTVGLLAEYARSAVRPTVAFPYAVIVVVDLALLICG